ncbi:F-box protein At3g22700-like [Papaver somniferum]|uniref:F-box protein At3g22700-like n=1 Tax=Papaver somniferum TaxID=3469 RepID=UPI000E6FE522|nr:F-box protein At3g22700-like [Papaver somniferum]
MSTSSDVVFGNGSLVCEILSRLPVDSLQSCKCVCRSWRSLIIRKDPYFIALHFIRSRARRHLHSLDNSTGNDGDISILIEKSFGGPLLSAELHLCQGRQGELQGRAIVQGEIMRPRASRGGYVVGILNGLICSVNDETNRTCIWNPSTGESTPWIYSAIAQQKTQHQTETVQLNSSCRWYSFGYDHATKEHKVTIGGGRQQQDPKWRKIDDVSLPPGMAPSNLGEHLYASGSIYWLHKGNSPTDESSILEFNVGSEKFRQISVPSSVVESHHTPFLVEADGRPAMLAPDTGVIKTSMKMFILYDDQDQAKKMKNTSSATCTGCSRSAGTTCIHYMEETLLLPAKYRVFAIITGGGRFFVLVLGSKQMEFPVSVLEPQDAGYTKTVETKMPIIPQNPDSEIEKLNSRT